MTADITSRACYPVWTSDSVRYRDLDPNAHVNHTAIAVYFEDGRVRLRHEFLRRLGDEILSGFVLAKLTLQFRREVRFPGDVEIGTGVSRLGTTSYTLTQGLFQDGECMANAEVVTVLISKETGRPTPLTAEIREVLERISLSGEDADGTV